MTDHGFKVCGKSFAVQSRSDGQTRQRRRKFTDCGIIVSRRVLCAIVETKENCDSRASGKPVDLTIEALSEHLEEGDLIVDGGNEWFWNQVRRYEELKQKGIIFGRGRRGANGPSLILG